MNLALEEELLSPRQGRPTVRRSGTLSGLNLLFRRLIITSVAITARLESNCDAHATCIILLESGTGARPDLLRPRGVLRTVS